MGSLFTVSENVEDFSDGFDLIKGHLSKSLILTILSEYEKMRVQYPDGHHLFLDCESMLTLLGENKKACDLLETFPDDDTFLLPKLRYASHCAALGNISAMNEVLSSLLKNPVTPHQMACAFIAAGRIGDRNQAIWWWNELLKEREVQNCVMNAKVLDDPDSFTSLDTLFLRERIEAVDLLYRLNIEENRDIELYCHTSSLHFQIGLLYNPLLQAIMYEGEYSAFTGFVVASAIASGAYTTVENLRDTVITSDHRVFQELILNLEGIRRNRAFYGIGEGLLTFFSTDKLPDRDYIENLKRETGGDIYQIYEMLLVFKNAELEAEVTPLLEILIHDEPDIDNKSLERKELDTFMGPCPRINI